MTQTTKVWIHGLVAAAVGAGASSMSVIFVAPEVFNPSTLAGWKKLAMTGAVAAVGSVIAYLRKSPIPDLVVTTEEKSEQQVSLPDGTVSTTASSTKTTATL